MVFGHCAGLAVRVNLLPVVPSLIRKVTVALAVAAPCLLFVASAEASPVRKAHTRTHKVTHRRVVSPTQSFARLANRRPERRLSRHPQSWLQKTQGAPDTADHDAAIQNNVFPASTVTSQAAPALQPLELLATVQAQLQSHDGFTHRSPRAPPVFG
jgi:hypothetical protein